MLVLSQKEKQRIETLEFSPFGNALLAGANGSWLDLWRIDAAAHPERLHEAQNPLEAVFDIGFLDGGTTVVAACGQGGLQVRDLTTNTPWRRYESRGYMIRVAAAPGSGRVIGITRSSSYSSNPGEEGYQSWEVGSGTDLRPAWFQGLPSHWGSGIAISPAGDWFGVTERTAVAVGERETTLVVRSLATGERMDVFSCPYAFVEHLAFSVSGDKLLAQAGMGFAVWATANLSRSSRKVLNDNRKHFTGIAFHPSGRYLAATSNDTTVKLYDTESWQVAKTFTWNVGRLRSVAFSPDGTLAAVGSDSGKIVVWDVDL